MTEFLNNWRPIAEFFYFCAGILLLGGLGVAFATYRSARSMARHRNTMDKVASYSQGKTPARINSVMVLIDQGEFAPSEVPKTLSPENRSHLVFVLNEWNEIGLGIRLRIYDDKLLFMLYAAIAIKMWSHLRSFVAERRSQEGHELAWKEFDALAVRWMIRRHSLDHDSKVKTLRRISGQLDHALKDFP